MSNLSWYQNLGARKDVVWVAEDAVGSAESKSAVLRSQPQQPRPVMENYATIATDHLLSTTSQSQFSSTSAIQIWHNDKMISSLPLLKLIHPRQLLLLRLVQAVRISHLLLRWHKAVLIQPRKTVRKSFGQLTVR
ncbi:hypothetical protein niasHS_017166 [Heterodera schachtii]|uniref:Uncharacterized protein n=1 Tax=Heterodera schachtii TaxID=97005 RepID=A0ABD2I0N4_HETSC